MTRSTTPTGSPYPQLGRMMMRARGEGRGGEESGRHSQWAEAEPASSSPAAATPPPAVDQEGRDGTLGTPASSPPPPTKDTSDPAFECFKSRSFNCRIVRERKDVRDENGGSAGAAAMAGRE